MFSRSSPGEMHQNPLALPLWIFFENLKNGRIDHRRLHKAVIKSCLIVLCGQTAQENEVVLKYSDLCYSATLNPYPKINNMIGYMVRNSACWLTCFDLTLRRSPLPLAWFPLLLKVRSGCYSESPYAYLLAIFIVL